MREPIRIIFLKLAINSLKNEDNITVFKDIQQFLPLEKSHISQMLVHNEEKNLIRKPDEEKYFTTIRITPDGIQQAERFISFLKKLLNVPEMTPAKIKKKQKLPNTTKKKPPPEFKTFIDNFSTIFYSPLKNSIKDSLQDYIPEPHLTNSLVDDVTDSVMDIVSAQLSTFYKAKG